MLFHTVESEPHLIEDAEGGTAPLTSLADDEVDRLARPAQLLALVEHDDLRTVELERRHPSRLLVLYAYLVVCPEGAVMRESYAEELHPDVIHRRQRIAVIEVLRRGEVLLDGSARRDLLDKRNLEHVQRHVLYRNRKVLNAQMRPLARSVLSRDGVVLRTQLHQPPLVLGKDAIYDMRLYGCHLLFC